MSDQSGRRQWSDDREIPEALLEPGVEEKRESRHHWGSRRGYVGRDEAPSVVERHRDHRARTKWSRLLRQLRSAVRRGWWDGGRGLAADPDSRVALQPVPP